MVPAVACSGAMHSVADWLPESASQFLLKPQVLQSDLPLPLVAAPLRLPAARAFGASADAAHLPLDLLARLLSARPLSGFCPACCMPTSEETPIAHAAWASLVALR